MFDNWYSPCISINMYSYFNEFRGILANIMKIVWYCWCYKNIRRMPIMINYMHIGILNCNPCFICFSFTAIEKNWNIYIQPKYSFFNPSTSIGEFTSKRLSDESLDPAVMFGMFFLEPNIKQHIAHYPRVLHDGNHQDQEARAFMNND